MTTVVFLYNDAMSDPNNIPASAFGPWLMRVVRTRVNPDTGRYYTQANIANGIGVTQQAIHNIVTGKRRPSADVIIKIANLLHEDVNLLLQLSGYDAITGTIVIPSSTDPVVIRLVKSVWRLMNDKRSMAAAVIVLEAMLDAREGNADSIDDSHSQDGDAQ